VSAPVSDSGGGYALLHRLQCCQAKQFGKPNNLFVQPTFRVEYADFSVAPPPEPPGCRDPALARDAGAHFARIDARGLRYPCRLRCCLGVMSKRSLKGKPPPRRPSTG
jgi:hypothetical protein